MCALAALLLNVCPKGHTGHCTLLPFCVKIVILGTVDTLLFSGAVQKGEKRGTALGFPTINIPFVGTTVSGIYAGKVKHKGTEYYAAIFADPKRGVLEAYLLDLDEELYGEEVTMTLLKKIRESETFSDDEILKERIAKDIEEIKEYFLFH